MVEPAPDVPPEPGVLRQSPPDLAGNPFRDPSPLPFGFPPFDRIRHEHYRPAFAEGVAEQLAEVEAIATSAEKPTFENSVEALERSGRLLDRVLMVFFNLVGSMADEQMQELQAELAPLVAEHQDAIRLDPRLFARVEEVHEGRDALTPEQQRVVERYHQDFVRAGAALAEADRDRLRSLNSRLTALTTDFGARVLAGANDLAAHVTDRAELDGLPEDVVASAAAAAEAAGLEGHLLTLVLPTIQPALSSLRDRGLRRRLHEAATGRGTRGDAHDTRALVGEITALRAERAALLGFADHAAYVVDDQTAGSTAAVLEVLGEMTAPAMANLAIERARIEELLLADGEQGPVQPWDWTYYAARDRAATYDVDTDALKPWFELDRVLHDGIFLAATRLYGVRFTERHDLPPYAEGVTVFEVHDEGGPDGGTALGLFVCDWFARPTKRGGAWMSEFVEQSHLHGTRPVVVVCLNVPRPPAGQPALMTVDEVRTGFHEFGHALHGLLSDVTYPRLQGTAVPRDFVEFPSQVNEMWAWWPEIVASYARHHETGEPLDQAVLDRLIASQAHGQGFDTVAMLAAALLDQEWHLRGVGAGAVPPEDVETFERTALERHGVLSELVPPRYRSAYFAHVFAGGYDAGYYSYLWSEVLDADLVDWFTEHGGPTRESGELFRRELLSRGGTVDPIAAFEAVRGRPPSTEPLLRRRGLLGTGR